MTTTYDVADQFLVALGAPRTPGMRKAVAVWLRFESGGNVIGNNPWNLHSGDACPVSRGFCPGNGTLPGQIGNRYAGPGDQNVAVFATINDGTKASANNLIRLSSAGYGYDKVISAARSGNAIGFLTALQNSGWSAGHYSHGKLVTAFASPSSYNTALNLSMPGSDGTSEGKGNNPLPSSGGLPRPAWLDDPKHVITEADARALTDYILSIQDPTRKPGIAQYLSAIWHPNFGSGQDSYIGKTVGDFTNTFPALLVPNSSAVSDSIGTPAQLPDIPKAIADFGNTVVRVAGFFIAIALIGFGLFIYSKGSSQPVEGV